jgi:cellulose biosynthesis protein BcsQ
MRLLSATNYEDIEEYLNYLPGITAVDIVKDKKSLIDTAGSFQYDLVLLSKELTGSEEMEHLIEILSSGEFKTKRVVFIYGEYDNTCDNFVRLLISHGIYDFYVGDEISSRDLERLVFTPASKDMAFGYLQSRFDNERYFNYKGHNSKVNSSFFNGSLLFNSGFKTLLKSDNSKRVPVEKLIISIISNQATGKSHTAWNLGYCLSKRGYATSLINIDRGYSANLFFDIDDIYYDLLDFTLQNNMHKDILDNCSKRKNLSIITGRLGDEKEISDDDFIKLVYGIRTKSDITVIDTRTGLSALTRLSIKSSVYDLLVFDCDIMHYHMNMNMLEELKDDFVPEKTLAVINNTNVKSSSHKFIYNELKSSGIPFKDIAFISNCGYLGFEVMHTGIVPYQAAGEEYKEFTRDMDGLLEKLCTRQNKNGFSSGIFGR